MRPRIAVLHHPRSFFPLDLFHQVGDAAHLLWVVDGATTTGDDLRLIRRLGTVVDTAGLDHDAAAVALGRSEPDGIVTFVDDLVEMAAALATRLDLTYHSPEVARVVVDKRLQRAALHRAGVPGPAFWPVEPGISPAEVAALAEQVTYPAVLKPAQGSGSRDIHSVRSPDQLRSLLADGATRHGALIEEYLHDAPGHPDWYASYLSVESVVSGGRTSHVALCGRFPLAEPFRETGNFIPAILPPSLQPEVLRMVDRTVDALGIRDAVIHTEIKRTPDGPRVIEVNGRLGGRPPFVLRTNSDVNLFQVACLVAAGVPVAFDGLADCKGVGYWLMLQPPMSASRVVSVDGLDGLTSLEEVDLVSTNGTAGERVSWRDGTESQVVTVRGRVADHAALAGTIAAIRSRVTITYDS